MVDVHERLPEAGAQAELFGHGEGGIRRAGVGGRIAGDGGGAVFQRLAEEAGGYRARHAAVGEPRLGGVNVFLQPVEQGLAVAGALVELRNVGVRVDETGREEAGAPVVDARGGGGRVRRHRGVITGGEQAPVVANQQRPVGVQAGFMPVDRVDDDAAIQVHALSSPAE